MPDCSGRDEPPTERGRKASDSPQTGISVADTFVAGDAVAPENTGRMQVPTTDFSHIRFFVSFSDIFISGIG
jgi:hypothetical protein